MLWQRLMISYLYSGPEQWVHPGWTEILFMFPEVDIHLSSGEAPGELLLLEGLIIPTFSSLFSISQAFSAF